MGTFSTIYLLGAFVTFAVILLSDDDGTIQQGWTNKGLILFSTAVWPIFWLIIFVMSTELWKRRKL